MRPCFNPRAHVGRDKLLMTVTHHIGVSIHAPTWGATGSAILVSPSTCFNPRAHVGRDPTLCASGRKQEFQSTRPRGARLKGLAVYGAKFVSIHAPTWGATLLVVAVRHRSMFQSTRPRGARHLVQSVDTIRNVSIHAPTWGATP